MMRTFVACAIAAVALGGHTAQAQTPSVPPPAPSAAAGQPAGAARADRYVQALIGWTFGDKGSQFFGAEGGFTLRPNVHIFIEGGQVLNAGGSAVRDAAEIVAQGLARTQSGVTVSAEQPTTFVGGGLRYQVAVSGSRAQPFVLAGGGMARVKQDVKFTAGGNNVTGSLAQYGIVLGTDLSGSFTKAQVTFGGGLVVPVQKRLMFEISYRMLRIFAEDKGITVNRAGLAFGTKF